VGKGGGRRRENLKLNISTRGARKSIQIFKRRENQGKWVK
jgi:hypothetical protein